ncbi:MAG: iron-sulfur cluster assembly accessory protein [Azoarcus sp.]|nr:iron-sulfur cluster assembly accessory protein [Azoarcus sp.]
MITLTPKAAAAIRRFMRGSETTVAGLRLLVRGGGCSGLQYGMRLEAGKAEDDLEIDVDDIKIFVDPFTLPMVDAIHIDFIDSLAQTGFRFDNPNANAQCACGQSFSI